MTAGGCRLRTTSRGARRLCLVPPARLVLRDDARRSAAGGRCLFAVGFRGTALAERLPTIVIFTPYYRRFALRERRAAVIGAVHQRRPLPRLLRAARLCAGRRGRARHRGVVRRPRRLPVAEGARRLSRDRRLDRGAGLVERRGGRHRHLLCRRRGRFSRQHRPSGGQGDRAAVLGLGHLQRSLLSRRHAAQPAGRNLRRADGRARPRPRRAARQVRLLQGPAI